MPDKRMPIKADPSAARNGSMSPEQLQQEASRRFEEGLVLAHDAASGQQESPHARLPSYRFYWPPITEAEMEPQPK